MSSEMTIKIEETFKQVAENFFQGLINEVSDPTLSYICYRVFNKAIFEPTDRTPLYASYHDEAKTIRLRIDTGYYRFTKGFRCQKLDKAATDLCTVLRAGGIKEITRTDWPVAYWTGYYDMTPKGERVPESHNIAKPRISITLPRSERGLAMLQKADRAARTMLLERHLDQLFEATKEILGPVPAEEQVKLVRAAFRNSLQKTGLTTQPK